MLFQGWVTARSALRFGSIARRTASTSANTSAQIPPGPRSSPYGVALSLVAWAPVALFFTYHVVSVASDKGNSMSPTFNPIDPNEVFHPSQKPTSDIVLLNRLAPVARSFKVGDVVTL